MQLIWNGASYKGESPNINNSTSDSKFKHAKDYLVDALGKFPIFGIRTTTLFERVAKDGSECIAKFIK
ncbi:MAG: hypothetical protein HRT52_11670 [Colwellia sp.]|nr:hypothetical protein [Colwellia sp.]NQZ81664.1 hypothetical protein [Colwellia sp.]